MSIRFAHEKMKRMTWKKHHVNLVMYSRYNMEPRNPFFREIQLQPQMTHTTKNLFFASRLSQWEDIVHKFITWKGYKTWVLTETYGLTNELPLCTEQTP